MKKDKDGIVIIDMAVLDDSEFISPFSMSEIPIINKEVAEFIENSTIGIPPKEKLKLIIYSDCIDEDEQMLYRKAIKEYYRQRYEISRKELIRNRIAIIIMFIVGVIILAISIFKVNTLISSEVIDIIAWVLIWEAADVSLFTNRSLRLKERRYRSYITMEIEYVNTKTA
ncbi:MAG: hypothetical protein PUD27_03450 [Solobacterium sp.]|nr:hypothetical protein [Solobacterium sp.]MDD6498164.1 hypothetical protein [Solobacterium sp.]MDD6834941.1 hypothetical protein [Solobacterium sp.]MDD6885719.1 hypothetical protein [Solobacterium sp.]MDY4640768.1 hypothetical protein [Erysipelotrichaceae bacterium]